MTRTSSTIHCRTSGECERWRCWTTYLHASARIFRRYAAADRSDQPGHAARAAEYAKNSIAGACSKHRERCPSINFRAAYRICSRRGRLRRVSLQDDNRLRQGADSRRSLCALDGRRSARMREGVEAGVVLPRMVVERILPQLHAHFGQPPDKTEFWQPIANFLPPFPPPNGLGSRRAYRAKIATVIEPAYRQLFEYMENEYLPHAPGKRRARPNTRRGCATIL